MICKTNKNKDAKGLFLVFGGLGETIIDSQVLTHVRDMQESGVKIDIWFVCCTNFLYKRTLSKLKQDKKKGQPDMEVVRGVRAVIPFSGIFNALILYKKLSQRSYEYEFVHARAEHAAHICGYLTFMKKFPYIWDCRGDTEAEYYLKYYPRFFSRHFLKLYYKYVIRWRIFLARKKSSKAIFVSEELRKEMAPSYNRPFEIIPCVASSEVFFFDPKLRNKIRVKLGFSENNKVFIYSGSTATWQCFEETVSLFKKLYDRNNLYKFIILTPNISEAKSFISKSKLPKESCKILSVAFQEVNAYLNAADFAVMLRKSNSVNLVASPVKFAEYCLTGLQIVMNDSVKESYRLSKKLNNFIFYNFNKLPNKLEKSNEAYRHQVSMQARKLLSRETIREKYLRIYKFLEIT